MAIRGSSLPSFGGNDKFALGRDGLVLIGRPRPGAHAQPAEESNAEVAIQFMRAGALLIVVFQGLFFAMHARLLGASFTRYLFLFHLISVGSGCAGFLATYSSLVRRHWRLLAFCMSSAVVICASLVTSAAHERDFLTYEMVLFLTGTGAFLPWEPAWQWGFTAVTLGAYAPAAGLNLSDLPAVVGWLTLLTSAGIGHVAVTLNRGNWRRIAQMFDKRKQEGARRETAIAELERTHSQLAQSETKLRRVFEASQDTVCINSMVDGRYIDISKDSLLGGDLGYQRDEALGSTSRVLRVWASDEQRERFSGQLRRDGAVSNFEADFRLKDGTVRACVISGSIVDLDGEPCVLSVTSDVSKLKQTERELIEAREAALAASQAKSEFLSSMSHEIRTPMNAILGMADLIGETKLGREQRKYLDIMTNNGNALVHLINDILDLAKIESGRLRLDESEFDLEELVEQLADTLRLRAHEKGLELAVRILPEVPLGLIGDQLRLRQVLINLVGNALKFTEHGEVVLTVENDPEAHEPGALRFVVRDTGIGIAAQSLDKIFDSFTQADSSTTRKYGGSGLGLAIGKRLVELMGGRLWAESQPDAGSSFSFTARFGVQSARSPIQAGRAVTLEGLRVLVVDDNATNRLILTEILSRRGASVVEADGGESALREWKDAEAHGMPHQLVLLDCRMPTMDGFKVAERLKTESGGAEPIILMLTSDDLHPKLQRMRQLGLKAYVIRPVTSSELLRAIAAAMGTSGAPEKSQPAQSPKPQKPVAARPLNILLAEDSPDNRLLIKQYLKNLPYQIDAAPNGEVAVEKFVNGRYDLILMDIQMPVMDGYTAVRKIRQWEREEQRAATPIVALTASALEKDVRNCLEAGCDVHLSKPVKKARLLLTIDELTANCSNGADGPQESDPRPDQAAAHGS